MTALPSSSGVVPGLAAAAGSLPPSLPSFRKQAGGVLATKVDGYCQQIRAPVQVGDQWAYTVLRRQYGWGSLLAMVGTGRAPTLADAVCTAERLVHLVIPGGTPSTA